MAVWKGFCFYFEVYESSGLRSYLGQFYKQASSFLILPAGFICSFQNISRYIVFFSPWVLCVPLCLQKPSPGRPRAFFLNFIYNHQKVHQQSAKMWAVRLQGRPAWTTLVTAWQAAPVFANFTWGMPAVGMISSQTSVPKVLYHASLVYHTGNLGGGIWESVWEAGS